MAWSNKRSLFLLLIIVLCSICLLYFYWHINLQSYQFNAGKKEENSTSSDSTCIDGNMNGCTKKRLILPFLRSAPKCRELFEEGSLITPTHWATPACKSKNYDWSELRSCLLPKSSRHIIAIIGDSRMRQITHMFVNYMENSTQTTLLSHEKHDEIYYQPLLNLQIEFFWRPFADNTVQTLFSRWLSENSNTVDMVIIGIGTWYSQTEKYRDHVLSYYPNYTSVVKPYNSSEIIALYEADLRNLSRFMNELSQRIPIVWASQAKFLSAPFREIVQYNAVAEKIWNTTGVTFWKSAYTVSDQTFHKSPDSNHYCDESVKALVNLLWNLYCNSKWNVTSDHCCSAPAQKAP